MTEGEKKPRVEEMETSFVEDAKEEEGSVKLDVFSVETYSKKSNPALIELRSNDLDRIEQETNFDKQ